MRHYTEGEVLNRLRVLASREPQTAIARKLGFTPQFINDVLGGRRALTEALAQSLGFRRYEYYLRTKPERSTELAT